MFILLTRILLTLLILFLVYTVWDRLGGKDKSLVPRLVGLLFIILLALAFFTPESQVGGAVANLLSFILKPLGLSIVLLISALSGVKNGTITKGAANNLVAAILILILSSTPILALSLAQQAELEAIKAIQLDSCCRHRVAAIVLLGQGTTKANIPYRLQIQLTESSGRIPYVVQLYRRKLGRKIIVSAGPRPEIEGHQTEADDIIRLLREYMGVPREDIIPENQGVSIRTSALNVKRILEERELGNRIILVTSALEIRRAATTFENVGIKVIPAPTDFISYQATPKLRQRLRGGDFLPSAQALLITTQVIEEYLSSLYYLIRGWLAPTI